MSKSPVKFVGAAARVVSGGSGGGSRSLGGIHQSIFKRMLGGKIRGRTNENQAPASAASIRVAPTQPLAKPIGIASTPINPVTPTVTNNTITPDPVAAQDRSQMKDAGELTGVAAPAGFSTMSSAVLDPMSRQPMGGVQPVPNIQEQATPEDVATYGVAGAAESMFGTPMQRQMSMGGSLMKRAYNYKK